MRDIINLQALKRSKNTKHNTIYRKAHRIIESSYETPNIPERDILKMAEKFPTLTINILVGGDITIRSIKDHWLIRDEGRFYTLYHRTLYFGSTRTREVYHIQDVFRDLNYIFASIVSHDDYALGIKKRNAYEVLDLISG